MFSLKVLLLHHDKKFNVILALQPPPWFASLLRLLASILFSPLKKNNKKNKNLTRLEFVITGGYLSIKGI